MSEIEHSVSVLGGFVNSEIHSRQSVTAKDQSDSHYREASESLLDGKEFGNPSWKRSSPHVFVATLATFLVGYHLGVINETLESISTDLGFNGNTISKGLVVSICLGGAFVGSLFCGLLADEFGRRRAFQFCALPMIIGSSVSAISKGFWGMLLGRFLVGLGMGTCPPLSALYVAEISPAHIRGAFGSCLGISACLGCLMSLFIGLPTKETPGWWRVCFWASDVPAVAIAFLMEFCAESPHWLFKKGRVSEAETEFERLLGVTHVETAMEELSKSNRGPESEIASFTELIHGQHFKVVFIGCSLFSFQQLSGINIAVYYSSTIFKSFGATSDHVTMGIGLINLLGSIIGTILIDRLGRKILLLGSFSGMAVALGLQVIAVSSFISSSLELWLSVGGMFLFVLMFALGAGPVPGLVLSEIFPGRIRAKAMAVCASVYWVMNFLVGLLLLRLLEQLGVQCLYTIFAIFCIFATIFVKRNLVETKGKTLQEIETALLPLEYR